MHAASCLNLRMSGSLLVIWFVITASIFPYTLPAQISQPYRFEHEQKNFDDYFTIIPMKEKGLVLYREMDKYKQNNKLWQVIFLDTMLQERIPVDQIRNLVLQEIQ